MAIPDRPQASRRGRRWALLLLLVGVAALVLFLRPRTEEPDLQAVSKTGSPARSAPTATPAGSGAPQEAAPPPRPQEPPVDGRVLSAWTGLPIAGAELTFATPQGAVSTRSGIDGRFRFVPPGPGSYQLAAVLADGHVPFGPDWGQSPIRFVSPVPPGTPELVVSLEPETRFTGRVEREDGSPVAAATVTLRIQGVTGPGLASAERSWTTDGRGEFRGTAPEEGVLVARHVGFLPATVALQRARTAVQSVRLVLKPAPEQGAPEQRVAGQVVDGRSAPVPGATVVLGLGRGRAPLGWALLPAPATTDADGRFEFRAVPEAAAWAQARTAELVSDPTPLRAGQTDLTLVAKPGGVLAGRVLYSDGRPAPAFALRASRLRRWPESSPVTLSVMDPEGRWEIRGLRGGAYLLEATASGAAASEPIRVDVPPSGRVEREIRLRRGHSLTGVVRDAKTRTPVPRAEVALEASPAEDAVLARSDTFTGEDGRFQLDGLGETPATVTVAAEGYNRKLLTLGRTRGEVEILLRPIAAGQEPATDLVGIGAVVNRSDAGLVLGTLVATGGAALAGLREGDTIVRIDGTAVAELGFGDAVQLLRGEEGSVVRVEVRRTDGSSTTVDVTRRAVTF